LVLEPGKTMVLEKQKVIELADRHKIALVGFDGKLDEKPEARSQ